MNWVLPISTEQKGRQRRLHLVPDRGWLVRAACGKYINLDFAETPPEKVRRCERCKLNAGALS